MNSRKEAYILAIQNEIRSQELYKALAKSFKEENAKKAFHSLIPLEEIHEEKLIIAYKIEFPGQALNIIRDEVPGDIPADLISDPKSILEFALSREDLAHDGFMYLALSCNDMEIRTLFEKFAKEEYDHKIILQTEIERIQGLISWYDPSELNGLVEE